VIRHGLVKLGGTHRVSKIRLCEDMADHGRTSYRKSLDGMLLVVTISLGTSPAWRQLDCPIGVAMQSLGTRGLHTASSTQLQIPVPYQDSDIY
jgi:hypothetical protein